MIAILTAMPREARGIKSRMQEVSPSRIGSLPVFHGRLEGTPVTLAASGVGRENSITAVRALLNGTKPWAIISLGFAGALGHDLKTGDLLLYRHMHLLGEVKEEGSGHRATSSLGPDEELVAFARQAASTAGVSLCEVEGLTTEAPVLSAWEKAYLRDATGASATDMESYWVAKGAKEAGIPFLAVRAVIDTAEQSLPRLVSRLAGMGPRKQAVMAPLLGLLQPWAIPGLVRLARQASMAQRSLAIFAAALAAQAAREGAIASR